VKDKNDILSAAEILLTACEKINRHKHAMASRVVQLSSFMMNSVAPRMEHKLAVDLEQEARKVGFN
jgi:hypothetical protein